MNDELRDRANAALGPLELAGPQREEAWSAFQEFPDGVERIARGSWSGDNPTALFLWKLRNGEHRRTPATPGGQSNVEKPWRVEAGKPGGTIMEGEPMGEDTVARSFEEGEDATIHFNWLRDSMEWDWIDLLWWNPREPGSRSPGSSGAPTFGAWQTLGTHRRVVVTPDAKPSAFQPPANMLRSMDE